MVTRTDPERVCLRHAESRRDIDREDYKYGFRVRIGKEPPTSLVPDTKPLIYMLCIYIYHSLPPIILSFSVWFWPSLFFSQSSTIIDSPFLFGMFFSFVQNLILNRFLIILVFALVIQFLGKRDFLCGCDVSLFEICREESQWEFRHGQKLVQAWPFSRFVFKLLVNYIICAIHISLFWFLLVFGGSLWCLLHEPE